MAKQQKEAEEKRKAQEQKRIEETQKINKAKIDKNLEQLNKEMDEFSVTLNKKHYSEALKLRDQIKSLGYQGEPPMKVHASQIYKNSFTFPQIAHNDYAVEQFETLSVAEQNLSQDVANQTLLENFLKSADEVAHNLT